MKTFWTRLFVLCKLAFRVNQSWTYINKMYRSNCAAVLRTLVVIIAAALSACGNDSDNGSAPAPGTDATRAAATEAKRPNFLLIVADDLGYSDLGVFGGEIGTPNLDALATAGVQLTNFHTAPTCSPTRAMLLSGTDNHLAGVGAMHEAKTLIGLPEHVQSQEEYAGHLSRRIAALPEVLKAAGYRTYMAGKWHLGMEDDQSPHARGFDKTFTMLEGGAGHMSDMRGLPAPDTDHAAYREDGALTGLPDNFYSTEFYADRLATLLAQDKNSEAPFFAYLAFTAPHWPLQAPAESIARHRGKYDAGYEQIFEQRIARQKALGLIDDNETGQGMLTTPPWSELDAKERARQIRIMEIYAAMVSDMDTHIGKLVQTLKATGEYDNTVIFFMSDNGAEHTTLSFVPGMDEYLARCCDNSLQNMGSADSFVFQEIGWARVSGAPTRFFKSHTTQGGVLSPAILFDPRSSSNNRRYGGFLSVMDVMPTFLDMAGVAHPQPQFNGRQVLPMKGASMASVLADQSADIHGADHVTGWELHFHRAIRKGNWKMTFSRPPLGDNRWKLYNLAQDPFEHHDVSQANPDVVADLLTEWANYVRENNVYVPDPPKPDESGGR